MSAPPQRTCVFKRCPLTEYVPRASNSTPTEIYAVDLNDWDGVEILKQVVLDKMSYLKSGIESIGYHLMGEPCATERPLADLFSDQVQHDPNRRGKGVFLHFKVKHEQAAAIPREEHAEAATTPSSLTLELVYNEGEQFDARTNTWKCVTAYAWDSGQSTSQIQIDANTPIAELPERFRQEILKCASQDQCFTTHYLHDNKSNVMFTSAVTIDGVLVSLDDRTSDEQTISELVSGANKVIHAAVVMTKTKIATPGPDMILDAVRPVLGDGLRSKSGTVCDYQAKEAPAGEEWMGIST